ncbi:MAG: ADP-heptose--LPS heptosyltransferase, partial [Proteobacteria bacterium]|nr:ADP-heptose--LPS heptosyltransferase [Pseudomonadota bacterium]
MSAPIPLRRNILVIKHGALGDFALAQGPMMAIRAHHLADRVVLLTTAPFADFAAASGMFDEIRVDSRPRFFQPGGWLRLIRWLRGGGFDRVYDLQTSDRSSLYFRLFPRPRPEWSGIARGASHRHDNPDRVRMHTVERQAEQLRIAGILHVPSTDLGWATADITRFALSQPYAVLAPGGSVHRADKRWPSRNFGELAAMLV